MDGTLWDAVDSYCTIWNNCFKAIGSVHRVARPLLVNCMGLPLSEILVRITDGDKAIDADSFLADVSLEEQRLMPKLGGVPYPGVVEGLQRLARRYRIFLLSNCGVGGLDNLMNFLGIKTFITEAVTYGETQRNKAENLRMLVEKYKLEQLVYVGDTDGDCRQTHAAGLPFVFAAYGFGQCKDAEMDVASFDELVEKFEKFKRYE